MSSSGTTEGGDVLPPYTDTVEIMNSFANAKLPKELFWKILDYQHPIKDKPSLARSSLVCRCFKDYVQDRLYHTIRLHLCAAETKLTYSSVSNVVEMESEKVAPTRSEVVEVEGNQRPSTTQSKSFVPPRVLGSHPLQRTQVLIVDHEDCKKDPWSSGNLPAIPSHSWLFENANLNNVETIYEETDGHCPTYSSDNATIGSLAVRAGNVKKYVLRLRERQPITSVDIHKGGMPESVKTCVVIFNPSYSMYGGKISTLGRWQEQLEIKLVLWPFSAGVMNLSGDTGKGINQAWYFATSDTIATFIRNARQGHKWTIVGLQEWWTAKTETWHEEDRLWSRYRDGPNKTSAGRHETFEDLTREVLKWTQRDLQDQIDGTKIVFTSLEQYLRGDTWKDELHRDEVAEWLRLDGKHNPPNEGT